ncbi:DUF6262 family protein [Heyndrickxia sporothermodurans]|uniref:Transposase n=1 Tax=Heyndrickxia sporothermodurans TaxID=46224 RepID=A0AB37H7T1_9BACI|nr:DUF6262 family protein [Heyndrickxia sporothermodurans]MBL7247480.1 transposase [Heyndrickxia sporothermodurans]MEB6549459.1 DUF6262 family protein [Heyndrickxia sporothermodurans]QQX24875.1 transposase [Heyndrickxia sporothermodurans]
MKNTSKIVSMAKEKTEEKKQKVINTINEMIANGEKVTFYSVYQKAGVSKSFVYNNKEIREVIEQHRKLPIKKAQTKDAKDVIIESQKRKIRELEKEIKQLQKDELWKSKYERLYEENKRLEKQLEKAYKY